MPAQALQPVAQSRGLFVSSGTHRLLQRALRSGAVAAALLLHLRHFCQRRALVQKIHRLVRQKFFGQVAAGKRDRRIDGLLRDGDVMVRLQPGPQAHQNRFRLRLRRLAHLHRAEAALQRRVLFDIFAVLRQRRRADELKLSPAKRRLQEVCRVNRALRCARADQSVHLVHKEDHILRPAKLREDVSHPLLKFAAVLRSCNHACHIQHEQAFALELLRNAPRRNILRHSLDDGRLAHPGFADQGGVILVLSRQDLQYRLDLLLPADNHFRFVRALNHIHTELVEQA